jgi:hypothetical protein
MAMKSRWVHSLVVGATLASAEAGRAHDSWLFRPLHFIDNCSTIPLGALPAPLGTYVNRFIHIQETKAEMDDFVIYKHMWYMGGKELGPYGKYVLDMIVHRLPSVPFPVVIETSKNPALDEQRLQIIIDLLAQRGINDPSRVIIAYPMAEGLRLGEAGAAGGGGAPGGGGGFGGGGGGGRGY